MAKCSKYAIYTFIHTGVFWASSLPEVNTRKTCKNNPEPTQQNSLDQFILFSDNLTRITHIKTNYTELNKNPERCFGVWQRRDICISQVVTVPPPRDINVLWREKHIYRFWAPRGSCCNSSKKHISHVRPSAGLIFRTLNVYSSAARVLLKLGTNASAKPEEQPEDQKHPGRVLLTRSITACFRCIC